MPGTISMVEDRDHEFLGCKKVGDSYGRTTSSFNRRSRQSLPQQPQDLGRAKPPLEMPEVLDFVHNGRKVIVECMFVEVKSHNDRLDARQEDWLNVLDLSGNARVCKFNERKKQPAKKQAPAAAKG